MSYCPACGSPTGEGVAFCGQCGERLLDDAAAAPHYAQTELNATPPGGWAPSSDVHGQPTGFATRSDSGEWNTSGERTVSGYTLSGWPQQTAAPPPRKGGRGVQIGLIVTLVVGLIAVGGAAAVLLGGNSGGHSSGSTQSVSAPVGGASATPGESNSATSARAVNTSVPYIGGPSPALGVRGRQCEPVDGIDIPAGMFVVKYDQSGSCVFGMRILQAYLQTAGMRPPYNTPFVNESGMTALVSADDTARGGANDESPKQLNTDNPAQPYSGISCEAQNAYTLYCTHPAEGGKATRDAHWWIYNNNAAPDGGN